MLKDYFRNVGLYVIKINFMFLLMWLLKINAACKTHVVLVLGSTGLDHPTLEVPSVLH